VLSQTTKLFGLTGLLRMLDWLCQTNFSTVNMISLPDGGQQTAGFPSSSPASVALSA